ncbi:hypothetical protein GO755_29735 [Spirosoma sp. HMF4905]|uniref:Uncharacterized protein n=1 Tax=Spirosoma arboris TaxID=2682092 RepID=A0A7K1SKB6_9BACT|nr:hypothetical protein [Spirosoma arboris]MVM34249.1 hypothetical protein [Spirosoma arboris]
MEEEIDFNEPIPHEPKTCVKCGKLTETVPCVIEAVQEEDADYPSGEHCYDCCVEEGYCFGCGRFSAGQQAYDFGRYPGYCENCQEQIRSNMCDDWDDNDYDHSSLYGTP